MRQREKHRITSVFIYIDSSKIYVRCSLLVFQINLQLFKNTIILTYLFYFTLCLLLSFKNGIVACSAPAAPAAADDWL